MQEDDLILESIITNQGDFFRKFNISKEDIIEQYADWKQKNNDKPVSEYQLHLLCKAGLYIAKTANSEEEGLEWKIELGEKIVDYCKVFGGFDIKFHEKILRFDKSLLQKLKAS